MKLLAITYYTTTQIRQTPLLQGVIICEEGSHRQVNQIRKSTAHHTIHPLTEMEGIE